MRVPKREHKGSNPADATTTPRVPANELGVGDARGTYPPHVPPLTVTGNRIWPQIAEMYMKGMNSVSPEACTFLGKGC